MKVYLVLLSLALICCSFVSCKHLPDSSDSTFVSSDHSATVNQENNQPSGAVQGEKPTINITDYDEYCKYVASAKLPESFIHYSQIESMGEFKGFVTSPYNPSEGVYFLTDANGVELLLYYDPIDTSQSDLQNSLQLSSASSVDMRTYSEPTNGVVSIGALNYKYLNGELLSIQWSTDSSLLTLYTDSFQDYPLDSEHSTFVSKILNRSEVSTALSALPDSVYPKSAK